MVSFPAEFPFVRRQAAAAVEPTKALIPEVQAAAEEMVAPRAIITEEPPPAAPHTPAIQSPALERRKVRRDAINAGALIRLDSIHGPPIKVTLLDISIAGIRFRTNHPLTAGDRGQIRLEVGPLRWTTRFRVVHCRADNPADPRTIGCAFLRTELLRPWPAQAA